MAFGRCVFVNCAAAALLAGCGGAQPAIGGSYSLAVVFATLLAQATPQPVATGPCLHEAAIVHEPAAASPDSFPKGALTFAVVTVTVGPDGAVTSAIMYKSTGTREGDKEALRAARETTYTPKVVDCKPTTGVYRLRVDFTPRS